MKQPRRGGVLAKVTRRARRVERLVRTGRRRATVLSAYGAWRRSPQAALRYLLTDPELDNFTYRISNAGELSTFLADALHADRTVIASYLRELDADRVLRRQLERRLARRVDRRRSMPYGRRLGWYAIVRHLKPSLLVETGIHDGLGSSVLLRAIERNAAEGVDGRLISFDTRRAAGWLIPRALRARHDVRTGVSLGLLAGAVRGRRSTSSSTTAIIATSTRRPSSRRSSSAPGPAPSS